MYEEPHATALKKLFATALLRHPDNPFAAARDVEPNDHVGRANWMATNWVCDPVVLSEMDRLRAALGPVSALPSKEQFALEVYREAKEVKPAEKLAHLKFFAELMGYMPQRGEGGANVNVNILNQPKIMRVPAFNSDDHWQTLALAHQQKLATANVG